MLCKHRRAVFLILLLLALAYAVFKAKNLWALDTYTHKWQADEFWLGYEYDSSRLAFDDDLYLGDSNGLWTWDNDSITVYNPQIGSVNYASWTMKVIGPCNVTVTEFYTDDEKFRATVAGGSSTVSTLEFDNKIADPRRLVVGETTYNCITKPEWDDTASTCWCYDTDKVYVKLLHSSTSTMTVWWTEAQGPPSGTYTPPIAPTFEPTLTVKTQPAKIEWLSLVFAVVAVFILFAVTQRETKPAYVLLLGFVTFIIGYEGLVMAFTPNALSLGVQGPLFLRVGLATGILFFGYLAYRKKGTMLSLFLCFGLLAAFFALPLWISGIQGRFVGAYYYGWYMKQDFVGMLDQPLLGAYDSTDLTVLRRQLTWAGEVELDFLALSGFIEEAPFLDLVWQNAEAMFQENEELGYPVKLCFMLEPRSFDGLAGMAERVWQNYAETEGYFRYQGKPLLFIFNGYIPQDLPLYVERLQSFTVRTTVDSPYSSIESQTTYVGDVVAVMPGFERPDWPDVYVPRDGGEHYREQWQTALVLSAANLNRPLIVMVTSWNELYESTHIEASVKYGYAYLNMTKEYAVQFKQK